MNDLTIFDYSEQSLVMLEALYLDVEVDMNTEHGIANVKDAAKKFQKLRTGIDKIRKESNEEAQKHINAVNDKAKSILTRLEPLEARFAEPLKIRKQRYTNLLEKVNASESQCEGASVMYIGERLEWLDTLSIDEFPEYKGEFSKALWSAKDAVSDLFAKAHDRETKRKEEKEKQRALAIDFSIQSMKAHVFEATDWKRSRIEEAIDYLLELSFDKGDYGDREEEAEQVRDEVVAKLEKLQSIAEDDDEPTPEPKKELNLKQVETLESLLYFVDGDCELAERLLDAIVDNKIPNVKFESLEQY